MKDLDGNELKIGNRVAVSIRGPEADFYIGKVVGFTAKKVQIEPIIHFKSWNSGLRLIVPKSCVCVRGK